MFTTHTHIKLISYKMAESNSKIYTCTVCNHSFTTLSHLKRHQKVHSESRDYICRICGNDYKYRKGLNRHLKKSHPQQSSDFIGKHTKKVKLIPNDEYYIDQSPQETQNQCRICGGKFSVFEDFIEHALECGIKMTTPFPI